MNPPKINLASVSTTCAKPTAMYLLVGKTNPKTGKSVILNRMPANGIPYEVIDRPCGKCSGCRIKKRMDLAIRLEHESQFHDHSWFVTVTYDDEHVPYAGSLVADHISKFIRSLRKKIKPTKCRFFAIGEYGENTLRPHYHFILFGPDFPDRELQYEAPIKGRSVSEISRMLGSAGIKYFRSPLLESVWKKGLVQITRTSPATMQYVAKYHVLTVDGEAAETWYTQKLPNGETVKVEKPQSRMSRNPGIGRKWIEKYWTDVYPEGTMVDGKGAQFAAPPYYDSWLEKYHPDVYQELKERRKNAFTLERELSKHREAKVAARKTKRDYSKGMEPRAKL